jgi:hypothetical protein
MIVLEEPTVGDVRPVRFLDTAISLDARPSRLSRQVDANSDCDGFSVR